MLILVHTIIIDDLTSKGQMKVIDTLVEFWNDKTIKNLLIVLNEII